MRSSILALPLLCGALVAGTPNYQYRRQNIDPDDPAASDPTTPPTTLNVPPRPSNNPFAGGLTAVPASCTDFEKPSDDCLSALVAQNDTVTAFSGGNLKYDDKNCSTTQEGQIQTAAWDALTLANFALFSAPPKNARDIATWKTYIGPDFSTQQQRIADNLNRVNDFQPREKFDIIMSCKDTKNWCGLDVEGKRVGGYAWTYDGWFGYKYYYITLCPVFFSLESLEGKITEIESALQRGDLKYAQEASWQKNTGQYFLHEMMHLNATGQPHIVDEKVDPSGVGPKAYGPELTYKLAQRALNNGGGATRASTNADSYAWLFWDLTGYFPKPDNYKQSETDTALNETFSEDGFHIHIGVINSTTADDDIQLRLNSNLVAMQTDNSTAPTTTSASPSETPTPCSGNQVQGPCIAGTVPSAAPYSGVQPPSCYKADGEGKTAPRINATLAAQAAAEYCQVLVSEGMVLSAERTVVKPYNGAGVAENNTSMYLVVVFNVSACPIDKSQSTVDFKALGQKECQSNFYDSIAQMCSQDKTWPEYNPQFTVEGGIFANDCALWSLSAN